jgi:predicted cupin superfamily sugar epimerase
MTALNYIQNFGLQPHPEGGYFKETYRSKELINQDCLPEKFEGDRNISTAIYYLLERGNFSAFHRIKSDECWHFYAGETLLVHIITTSGSYTCIKLGNRINEGEMFQYVVPAGAWFAAEPAATTSFAFVGCTVAPGFDFEDFEMADKRTLLNHYPLNSDVINRLAGK